MKSTVLALMGMLDSVHGHAALISPPSRCVPAKPANGALKSAVGIVDLTLRRHGVVVRCAPAPAR